MRRHQGLIFALVASLFVFPFAGAAAAGPSPAAPAAKSLPQTVLTALSLYWTQVFPAAFGQEFASLRGGVHPLDSGQTLIDGKDSGVLCIPNPAQIAGNMYYCPSADGIVYDTGVLVPVLLHHYGVPGLISSFAHEFGHAVAARVGVAGGDAINIEIQADCFAGNFLSWLNSGASTALSMTKPELLQAFQPIVDFRDQISTTPIDPGAHGLGIDRAQAVLLGFRSDPTVCRDIGISSTSLALGRFDAGPEQPPRWAGDSEVLAAARSSASLDNAVPATSDVEVAATIGQFGLGAAVVLAAPGADACDVGRWTASVYGTGPAGSLGSWVGDVDEGLDLIRYRPQATFADLTGFIDGFATDCISTAPPPARDVP